MKRIMLWVLILGSIVSCYEYGKQGKVNENKKPKNIILLIGDGMGVAQIYAGMSSSSEPLCLESFTDIGFHKTYSADNYITDSGAGGTALACGIKTNNHYIGVDTLGIPLKSILHYAEDNGLATGLISTSAITHATPASFIAHVPDLYLY